MSTIDTERPTHEIDVLDRDFIRDPWDGYARLRAEQPIFFDESNDLWVLTRHEDVTYASIHPELFCSGRGVRPTQSFDLSLIALDGERHIRQRRLINQGFSPRMIRTMEERIRQVVTETLDRIASRGSCDFVADIAVPIPMVVIAELMGLPVEDRDRFWRWSDDMMAGEGRSEGDPELEAAGRAFGEYMAYVAGLVADRRERYRTAKAEGRTPEGDDLISVLVAAAEEGIIDTDEHRDDDTLAEDELMMFLVVVIVAGNETTRNALSGGMWALHRFRDQWEAALRDPGLWASAPDEICRWVSPVISFVRTATCDTEIGGQRILEGERVLMLYQSANRDEAVFDDPDALRLDRSPNPQLAFGVGPHVCMGINLARLEIRVLFEELARRLPDIDVAEGATPTWGDSTLVHAIESLPVTFTPEAADASA
jgi:cytochrome P450 family 142 subfamily A polypeptide 1